MMTEIAGDLLDQPEGVLLHQVNAQGAMGSGLAASLRRRWPAVYGDYRREWAAGRLSMGRLVLTRVGVRLWVASLVGQRYYGRQPGRRYTDYAALRKGIEAAAAFAEEQGVGLYLPHGIGCGLGGGDWTEVSAIIGEVAPDAMVVRQTPDPARRAAPGRP